LTSLLLVDDDVSLLQALSRFLADFGYRVASCSTFEDAKEQIMTSHPEIVVTDVRLGAFNGLQLAMLARDMNPNVRLVVFSGFDDPVLKTEARRIGAAYLVKPITGIDLVNELRAVREAE
jgi:DNA-binding response OmpR family regulator